MSARGRNRGARALTWVAPLALALGCAIAAAATPAHTTRHGHTTHAASKPQLPALPDSAAFPTGAYQTMLDDYLRVTSRPGEPLETRFFYGGLFTSPGRVERFEAVRNELLTVDPARLTVRQRHAWAIDTYNFLVIQLIVENVVSRNVSVMEKGSRIFGIPLRSVQNMQVSGHSFFEAPVARLGGRDYSLDQFERAFVFDGYPRPGPGVTLGARPATLDPRAHFALARGAIGSPALQPRAFVPESLDVQLDRACREALASPRHLVFDPALQRLAASAIFGWYVNDFGGSAKAYEFLERYAPDAVRPGLAGKPDKEIDTAVPWDWDLNILRHLPVAGADSTRG